MKKLLSLLLAIAMVFSLGVGALAEDSASEATGSGTETGDNKTIGSTDEGKNTASANVTASYTPSTTTTPEAKWGASATDLNIGSGTLTQALDAATATGSTVKYIQLQKSVTMTSGYTITGGTFTLDLNGKTISGSGSHVFTISTGDADVTFTDTATGGKVTATTGAVVLVLDGKLTINKGTYESECDEAVQIVGTVVINDGSFTSMQAGKVAVLNGGTLTINGGSFSGGLGAVSIEDNGTTTIKGGTFNAGSCGHIRYQSGKLDLANYNGTTPLTDLTVYNSSEDTVTLSDNTIKLPEGYAFYLSTDTTNQTTVTELAAGTKYAIKSTGGTTTDTATITGVSVTIDGVTYGSGSDMTATSETNPAKVTSSTDRITYTLYGTNLDKLPDTFRLKIKDTVGFQKSDFTISQDRNSATYTLPSLNITTWFPSLTTAFEVQYKLDGSDYVGTGVYYVYEVPAEITSVSVTVKDASGGDVSAVSGTYTVKPGYKVTITAKGTNLDQANNSYVMYTYGLHDTVSSGWWTISTDKTTATYTLSETDMAKCTSAFEIRYSNSAFSSSNIGIGTGIYIQYQAETTSVGITWGSLSFTYSDETSAWSPDTDGANTVKVENSGTSTIEAAVAFTKSDTAANITNVSGTFDKSTATLIASTSASGSTGTSGTASSTATFTLTLSGKPDGALDGATIGTVTVTITKAA